jgi:uncharacterized protein YndB with AHSA1/START domain
MNTFLFVVAFCIVAVFVYMARYSGRLRVAQTRLIAAPVADVYAKVADFGQWREWNPWLEHEPDAPTSVSAGTGGRATYAWDGARIGSGAIENVRLISPARIVQRMRFRQPFRFRGRGEWQFADRQGQTEVSWRMRGRVAFTMRAFAPTVQGMIELDFRYGLERLASALERDAQPSYTLAYLGVRDVAPTRYAYQTYNGPLAGLDEARRKVFAELRARLGGAAAPGDALAVYASTNVKRRTTVCHVGLPIGDADADGLPVRELPAHQAYVVRLRGSTTGLEIAWYQAIQRMRIEGIEADPRVTPFERYLGGTVSAAEGDEGIDLHVPVRRRVAAQPASFPSAKPA